MFSTTRQLIDTLEQITKRSPGSSLVQDRIKLDNDRKAFEAEVKMDRAMRQVRDGIFRL